jgi:VWFA-related protein
MKNQLFNLFFIFIFSFSALSQVPTPTPKADEGIVKISTILIQVDVSVTDPKGKPVKDLKLQDFEIYENGKIQKITNFSFITNKTQAEISESSAAEKLSVEAPAPAKEIRPNEVRRTIALVVDDLSLSFENVRYVKRALRKFVQKQMQKGDLVAIIRASSGIGALQQFTSNKNYLDQAIDKINWKKSRGAGLIGAFRPTIVASGDLDPGFQPEGPTAEGDIDNFRKDIYSTGVLGAIRYVIDGMEKLPGRKSVMLLSDGMNIFSGSQSGLTGSARILNKLNSLIDDANEAGIPIYTIDTRGVQTLDFTAADDLGSRPVNVDPGDPEYLTEGPTRAITQDKTETLATRRRTEFRSARDGLNYLAERTGGDFIRNTNDIFGGIRQMLDDQSYYLLAFETDSETFDPEKSRLNRIAIKVKRENVNVSYDSDFFGSKNNKRVESSFINLTANEQLYNALYAPFAIKDIDLKLSPLFQGDEKNKTFINSLVYIDVSKLKFSDTEKGNKKAVFDILAANFGDNGVPTDQQNRTFTIDVTREIYQRMLKEGFIYYFSLPVKKAGAYQMRVAIRDKATNKIGSASQLVGIPKLKNKKLALSGIALENIPYNKWNAGVHSNRGRISTTGNDVREDLPVMTDAALRKYKRGTVLRYGLEIYNPKINFKKKRSRLFYRTRIFHENKVVYEGKDYEIDLRTTSKKGLKPLAGAINLGTTMKRGEYILQIIVTDKFGERNRQIATQFIQFEIVE